MSSHNQENVLFTKGKCPYSEEALYRCIKQEQLDMLKLLAIIKIWKQNNGTNSEMFSSLNGLLNGKCQRNNSTDILKFWRAIRSSIGRLQQSRLVGLVLVFLGKVLDEGMNCPGGVISIFLVTKIFFDTCQLFFDLPGLHSAHANEIPVEEQYETFQETSNINENEMLQKQDNDDKQAPVFDKIFARNGNTEGKTEDAEEANNLVMYWQKEHEETLRTDKDIFQNDTASSFAQQDNPECWGDISMQENSVVEPKDQSSGRKEMGKGKKQVLQENSARRNGTVNNAGLAEGSNQKVAEVLIAQEKPARSFAAVVKNEAGVFENSKKVLIAQEKPARSFAAVVKNETGEFEDTKKVLPSKPGQSGFPDKHKALGLKDRSNLKHREATNIMTRSLRNGEPSQAGITGKAWKINASNQLHSRFTRNAKARKRKKKKYRNDHYKAKAAINYIKYARSNHISASTAKEGKPKKKDFSSHKERWKTTEKENKSPERDKEQKLGGKGNTECLQEYAFTQNQCSAMVEGSEANEEDKSPKVRVNSQYEEGTSKGPQEKTQILFGQKKSFKPDVAIAKSEKGAQSKAVQTSPLKTQPACVQTALTGQLITLEQHEVALNELSHIIKGFYEQVQQYLKKIKRFDAMEIQIQGIYNSIFPPLDQQSDFDQRSIEDILHYLQEILEKYKAHAIEAKLEL